MASKFSFSLLLFLLLNLWTLSKFSAAGAIPETGGLDIAKMSSALSNKGYNVMSLTLEMTIKELIPDNQEPVTIFCPLDKAFSSTMKYGQPPLTLIQYQISPSKLDREALESLPYESKVDTLLPGHPLVITTISNNRGPASINNVKITEWEMYNDGRVIVHGIEDFFDPAFQTLIYPAYDGGAIISRSSSSCGSRDADIPGLLYFIAQVIFLSSFVGGLIGLIVIFV